MGCTCSPNGSGGSPIMGSSGAPPNGRIRGVQMCRYMFYILTRARKKENRHTFGGPGIDPFGPFLGVLSALVGIKCVPKRGQFGVIWGSRSPTSKMMSTPKTGDPKDLKISKHRISWFWGEIHDIPVFQSTPLRNNTLCAQYGVRITPTWALPITPLRNTTCTCGMWCKRGQKGVI